MDDFRPEWIADAEALLRKLHEHWGDCLWVDASELMALEKVIEAVREMQPTSNADDFGGMPG